MNSFRFFIVSLLHNKKNQMITRFLFYTALNIFSKVINRQEILLNIVSIVSGIQYKIRIFVTKKGVHVEKVEFYINLSS